jgi:hypothetical protein
VVNFYKCKPLALKGSSFAVLLKLPTMKSLLTLLIAACVLYFGRENETTFSIISTPPKTFSDNERARPVLFDMSYQRGRILGSDLVIIGHDVFESHFVALRFPLPSKAGDTLVLSDNQFHYPADSLYTLQKVWLVVDTHTIGETHQFVGMLHCQLRFMDGAIESIERRIEVSF